MFEDKHKVELNKRGGFSYEDTKLHKKYIPFIRYRFKDYGEGEIAYIRDMMGKFDTSCHLAELSLTENIGEVINTLKTELGQVAIYIYVPISNNEVENGFDTKTLATLKFLNRSEIDRVMIKDNSTNLFSTSLEKLKAQIKEESNIPVGMIGVCSSPLSFEEECCLTAVKARELLAKYVDCDTPALPTANHQSMNRCGCIRYFVVNTDILDTEGTSVKKRVKEGKVESVSRASKEKKVKNKGLRYVDF